jgi:hypothetical protein
MLPDVALLGIFEFYMDERQIEEWHTLVHVCRKWRIIVFGSPRRLNLRLLCTAGTPTKEMLDVWPPLPIVLWADGHKKWGVDNIIDALEHNDRICQLSFTSIPNSQLEPVLAAMQQPFRTLTDLYLDPADHTAPIVPPSFLGVSAPRLQKLTLHRILFPGLPKLLLSATHLVDIDLWEIPYSAYLSPEAIITVLSALIRLERLEIGFESPRGRSGWKSQRPPPPTRILLPILNTLRLRGFGKYMDDLVARIDAPLLDNVDITFFRQFNTPQVTQFISRTPKLMAHGDEARVVFCPNMGGGVWDIWVSLLRAKLRLGASCRPSNLVSSLAQICRWSFPRDLISAVEHLYIFPYQYVPDDTGLDVSPWLDLLHPFTAVKSLYVSEEFVPHLASTLQEIVGERVTEVLPALKSLFLEGTLPPGPILKAIGQFVVARHLSGHPIAVFRWKIKNVYNDEFS